MLLLPGLLAAAAAAAAATKPHIFTFIVDDLGWGNVGFHRAAAGLPPTPEVQTQVHIKQLPKTCSGFMGTFSP